MGDFFKVFLMQWACIPGMGVHGCSSVEEFTAVLGILQRETEVGGAATNTEPGCSLKDTYTGNVVYKMAVLHCAVVGGY